MADATNMEIKLVQHSLLIQLDTLIGIIEADSSTQQKSNCIVYIDVIILTQN